MTQNAIVTRKIDDNKVEVTVERGTACGGNCGSCGASCSFKNKLTVTAANSVYASVGDKVIIESQSLRVIRGAALVYLLPILTLLAGYSIAVHAGISDGKAAVIGVCSVFLGMLLAALISRRKNSRQISFDIIGIE